jgi:protein-S-isoprenylcysteine O-methyltransferase Ste14
MTSANIYRVLFALLLVLLGCMRVYFMVKVARKGENLLPDDEAKKREGGPMVFIFRVVMFVGLLVLLWLYFTRSAWLEQFNFFLPGWLRWLSFVIGLFSVCFWIWTQINLDTLWSAQLQLAEDHHLITTGPYTYIRHPLYAAMIAWCLAVTLLSANWIFAAISLLAIVGLIVRVPREEHMMLEKFGDSYRQYMRITGRFFPRLYA